MPNGIQYQIHRADVAGCPPLPNRIFNDPAVAAATAKELSRQRGEKLMVKPILNQEWRKREENRIADGTYRPLPLYRQEWWNSVQAYAIHKDHFAHPSIEKPGWLAYTKNAEDGIKDKQTVVRPGSYLKQYFSYAMNYYGCSERKLVEQFMLAFGPIEVKFATTEDEIVSVYDNGPNTCMKGKNWPTGRNPAYIYAAGDLQVAYLGELDAAKARTLVWPEKKIFSRVYGDIARLTNGLERLGYKWGAPIGAKLKRVELRKLKFDPNRGIPIGCFLAPYIDKKNQQGGGHLAVIDKGDHLVICEEGTPGSHHCGLAEGYSGHYVPRQDEQPTFTCDHCGKAGLRELTTIHTVNPDDADDDTDQSWCHNCAVNDSYHCGYSGERFAMGVPSVDVDGDDWAKYYADMYAETCQMTGKLCNINNMLTMYFGDDKTPKKVSGAYADRCGGYFRSHVSRRYYLRIDRIALRSGYGNLEASKTEIKTHGFICDGCDTATWIEDRWQTLNDDRIFCEVCHDRIKEGGKIPVSKSRKEFEQNRLQLNLIAAE